MTALYDVDELYDLLPAVHRIRDVENGGVLRELIEVIADQVNAIAESLEQAYDDQFIETCAPWVAPYIGDLVGYRTLHSVVPGVASPRAEVANTIRYRRRKGTAAMLEQLARDVTGWPARVVEMFELLATTQYMNHLRPHATATADLRGELRLDQAGRFQAGAFDGFAHTADVRRVTTGTGRYGIQNVAVFLWRVQAHGLVRSPLVDVDGGGHRYRFDPLGTDKQLFNRPRTEEEITHLAEPFDVPVPLTRRWLAAHLVEHVGPGRSLLLETRTPAGIDPVLDVRICDLSDDPSAPGSWQHVPGAGDTHVAVDPVLGRVAFGAAPAVDEQRLASFHFGSALAVGGGGYERPVDTDPAQPTVSLASGGDLAVPLASVAAGGTVEITDCDRYLAPASITTTTPPDGTIVQPVVVRSANRIRPTVVITDQLTLSMEPETTVVLDGLLLAGGPLVLDETGDTGARTVVLRHSTLVPGWTRDPDGSAAALGRASLVILDPFATVVLDHCITGPIVAVDGAVVRVADSVVDAGGTSEIALCGRASPPGGGLRTVAGPGDRLTGDGLAPGAHVEMTASTVIGRVHAQRMDVSDSLLHARAPDTVDGWPAPVWAARRQVGCVRFSYVPPGSRTPRRFECVPPDGTADHVVPQHTSLRYGDPGYCQLRHATHPSIRTGASDESEIGVTHELHQPQRETNLRLRLDEYLRFGLEAGFFYAT